MAKTSSAQEQWLAEFFYSKALKFFQKGNKLELQFDGSLQFSSEKPGGFKEFIQELFGEYPLFFSKKYFTFKQQKIAGIESYKIQFSINPDVSLETLKSALLLSPLNFYREESEGRHGITVPAFSLEGLELINHINGLDHAFVCKDDDAFLDTLKLLNQPGIPDNFDLVLTRVFGAGEHVQPIKIERRGGVNHVIVMDSRGNSGGQYSYLQQTVARVAEILPQAHIYQMTEERQYDGFSCYITTAKDEKQMVKMPNLYTKLEVSESHKTAQGVIHTCKMPEEFFAMVQSRAMLQDYIGDTSLQERFTAKDGTLETLKQKVERPRESGEVATPNLYGNDPEQPIPSRPDHFARKYAQNIDKEIKSMTVEKLEEIIFKQDSQRLNPDLLKEIAGVQQTKGTLKDHEIRHPEGFKVGTEPSRIKIM